jgi:hypothetical protein
MATRHTTECTEANDRSAREICLCPTRRHYHVIENTPGYLPDSDPAIFTHRRDAVAYARDLAASLRDDGYRVRGSNGDYYGERDADDLGRAIETLECTDACETEAQS